MQFLTFDQAQRERMRISGSKGVADYVGGRYCHSVTRYVNPQGAQAGAVRAGRGIYDRIFRRAEISTSLDAGFCCSALEWALRQGRPEIFNTDQGAQFTSEAFTSLLEKQGILISMDGRGRALDNVFVERLWRTVKYEEVYLKDYGDPPDAVSNLGPYFTFYNGRRPHQALNYRTPESVYRKLS